MSESFLGLPVWLWVAAVALLAAVAAWAARRAGARRRVAEAETLAQRGDADHEGAKTRHGGGA